MFHRPRRDAPLPAPSRSAEVQIVARLRATLWLALGTLAVLSLRDLWGDAQAGSAIPTVRAAAAGAALALLAALRSERGARHAVALALVAGVVVCADIAVVCALLGDVEAAPLLLGAVAMFGAAVFRCGLAPQLVLVAVATLALLANAQAVTGGLAAAATYHGAAALAALAMSVYVAYELEEQQRAIAEGERALRRSEAYFRSLIENSSDLITVISPDGTIRYDSPAHERLLGYARGERVGTDALALVHPDDIKVVLDAIASGMQVPGATATLEYRYRHRDGTWRHMEAVGRNLLDDPDVAAIVVNSRDITARRAVEAELRRSQAYLKAVFDHAPLALYLNDLEGRFIDGNRAAEELVGYEKAELVGETFLTRALVRPEELARAAELLLESRQGPMGPVRLGLHHRDGRPLTVEVRSIPLTLDGQPRILGIAADVTERERVRAGLRLAEERHHRQRDALIALTGGQQVAGDDLAATLRHITETDAHTLGVARASIWRFNRERTAIECLDLYEAASDTHSAGATLLVADQPAYFRSLAEMDVMAADDAHRDPRTRELAPGYLAPLGIGAMLDAPIHLDGMVDGVLCHEHVGGTRVWTADEKTFAVAIVNLVSLAIEGWERRQAERAQSRLTAILDVTPDVVGIVDARDEHFVYLNPAGRALLGIGADENVAQRHLADVLPDGANARLRGEVIPAAARDGAWSGECAFRGGDGHEIPVSMAFLAHRSAHDVVERYSTVSRDITERKRVEAQLRDAKQAAEAANLAKSEFLANMSHEIRTPMNGIIGMTDLALQTELTPEQRECLELVATSGDALLTVINDVLDFSKIEAGKLDLDPVAVDLREALADAVRPLAMRAHLKELDLAYEVQPHVPAAVTIDPHRLRQVLTNLIGNAIKFTERGEIVVSLAVAAAEAGEEHLHFSVRDTGVGIPAEKQQVIFQAFAQADNSTTRRYGGTGLGLTISRKLVSLMGGRLWVESAVGSGSTFHFTVRCPRAAADPRPLPAALARLAGRSLLVVDDNATTRRILTRMLLGWRMCPTTVASGGAAVACLSHAAAAGAPFPLVIIDAHMPGMDGFELAARIRDAPRLAGSTIMMLSSADLTGEAARCRELGVGAFLTKPIREAELLGAVCAAVAPGEAAPAAAPRGAAPPSAPQRSLHVLLAEDNAVNQKLVVRLLEKRGHTAVVAGNGREAVAAIGREAFDVVFMDVQMPEMDGLEATAAIRAAERASGGHVPIIAMTAHAMRGDEQRCLAAGMDDYLAKPIDPKRLFALLGALAERLGDTAPAEDVAPQRASA